jgi:hypothetical protein
MEQYMERICWQDSKKDRRISTKRKKKFGNTPEMMEGFCFVMSIIDHNMSKTGDDDDDRLLIMTVN